MKTAAPPKISIIVPVFCAENQIGACIDSLINQTLRDIEIILVDDGSTDYSGKICDSYAERDARIHVIHRQNGGVSSARNAGLEIVRGDFIGFVDSDDTVERDMYEYLLEKAESCTADVVQCGMLLENDKITTVLFSPKDDIIRYGKESLDKEFFRYFSGSSCTKLYRKTAINDLRYDSSLPIGEDMRFNLDALLYSSCTVIAQKAKYRYIQRENSACHAIPTRKSLTSYKKMLDEAAKDFATHTEIAEFITVQTVKNALDVCSKATRYGNGEFDDLFAAARADIIRLKKSLKRNSLSAKDKLKVTLVSNFPCAYKILIGKIKK